MPSNFVFVMLTECRLKLFSCDVDKMLSIFVDVNKMSSNFFLMLTKCRLKVFCDVNKMPSKKFLMLTKCHLIFLMLTKCRLVALQNTQLMQRYRTTN